MNTYTLEVAGVTRELPIMPIAEHLAIASFVILGDAELVTQAAEALVPKLPKADLLVTAEAKGIPLCQELARLLGMPRFVVARKSVKPYMLHPLITEVESITTQKKQILCLDASDVQLIHGKQVILVDDVISTGESLRAMEQLAFEAGAETVGRAAILAEGAAAERPDIVYLEKLPLFQI
ncbi:MAG: phosphoribosyltransferase family protein [Sporolactobacillus sp.]